jgi:hypothetical protein
MSRRSARIDSNPRYPMPTWSPLFFLPKMRIQNPFENEYLAIVPPEDERCVEINSRHPTFLPFLDKFTDAFQRKLTPSALLLRDDAPAWVKSWETVGGFRDILSICAVVHNRTAVLIHHLPRTTSTPPPSSSTPTA